MTTPTYEVFMASLGQTLELFKIHEKLGLSTQDCYDILTEKEIGNKWPLRSLLLIELTSKGVLNTLSSENSEEQTGTFSVAQMIKRISEYTGANDTTLVSYRKQMLPMLHDDTAHLLYLFDSNCIPMGAMKNKFSPAYTNKNDGGPKTLLKAMTPFITKALSSDEPQFNCAAYAEALGADKDKADKIKEELIGSDRKAAASASISQNDEKPSPKASNKKANQATADEIKKPVGEPAVASTPKPGHLLRTKLANQIDSLPESSKSQFVDMVKAFIPDSELKPNLSLSEAVKSVPADVVMKNFNATTFTEKAEETELLKVVNIKSLLSLIPQDKLHEAFNAEQVSKSKAAMEHLDEEAIKSEAIASHEPTLDDYVKALNPTQKQTVQMFVETLKS